MKKCFFFVLRFLFFFPPCFSQFNSNWRMKWRMRKLCKKRKKKKRTQIIWTDKKLDISLQLSMTILCQRMYVNCSLCSLCSHHFRVMCDYKLPFIKYRTRTNGWLIWKLTDQQRWPPDVISMQYNKEHHTMSIYHKAPVRVSNLH